MMFHLFRYQNKAEKDLASYIKNVFGFYPHNIALFQQAFTHKSMSHNRINGISVSNERLEYLGDAVLSSLVAEYLFKKYPTKQEGFLTEMRSRIVSRSSLNKLSSKLGFDKMISHVKINEGKHIQFRTVGGNAFEAFTGALFLDRGYNFTYKIIVDRIMRYHLNIDDIEKNEVNFKSRLLEWGQKHKHHVEFKLADTQGEGFDKLYNIKVVIDEKEYGNATDYSIKGAEQLAAEKSWHLMKIQN